MARDLKDSLLTAEVPAEAQAAEALAPLGEMQIPATPAQQKLLTQIVIEDFRKAQEARNQRTFGHNAKGEQLTFDSWLKELVDLYYGRREPKTEPWKYCSNRSMMIGMTILEVLHSRIFPAIYNEELTRWRPTERNDAAKAKRVEKLMYWWIRVRCRLRDFFDKWTRIVVGYGQALTESTFEVQLLDKGQMTPETTQPTAEGGVMVVPAQKALTPLERGRSDIIPWEDVFLAPGATDLQEDPVVLRVKYCYRELEAMEREGSAVNVSQSTAAGSPPLKDVLQVHPVADVSGLTPQETEALADVARRNQEVTCLRWYGRMDLDGDGYAEQLRVLVDPEHQLYLGGIPLTAISQRGIRHLEITQYLPRFDEPMGLWGLGVLEQVKEMAQEIDAIFNQMTDANSLSILRPLFIDDASTVDAGAIKIAPLKSIAVPNPQQAVFLPEFNIQTEKLINAISLVIQFIERLTAASDYVLGRESEIVGGSGTATRTQAIMGSANQRHSVPVQRLREGAARILTHHLDLLQTNLPPGLETRVLGPTNEPVFESNELTEQGISGEFDAFLLPDESFGSKETERQLAQLLYEMLVQNPLVATDPTKLYRITADVLESFGKDPAVYLGPEPPYRDADTPDDEHTLLLQGDFGGVRASFVDNPIEHMMAHLAFLQDPGFLALEPALQQQVSQALQMHIQEHMQMLQAVMSASSAMGKGTGAGGGTNGKPGGNGRAAGGPAGAAPAVGPEPRVGSTQNPRAQARAVQKRGESQPPA